MLVHIRMLVQEDDRLNNKLLRGKRKMQQIERQHTLLSASTELKYSRTPRMLQSGTHAMPAVAGKRAITSIRLLFIAVVPIGGISYCRKKRNPNETTEAILKSRLQY